MQIEEVIGWQGHAVVGRDGEKLGKVEEVYLDEETNQPEWLTVKTGMFGPKVTFVPLAEARLEGDEVHVPYDKGQVKEAPSLDPDGELSQDDEARLYRHYGLDYSEARSESALPAGGARRGDGDVGERAGAEGRDTSGPTTDDAMTRSEEQLRVGTERREAGRARLRKYVVTEDVQTTVPVSREEVRVEREPITDANREAAYDGPAISEDEHEVVLHEERPVVDKQTVAKERVRLGKEQITEEETVSGEVRKERIETEGDERR